AHRALSNASQHLTDGEIASGAVKECAPSRLVAEVPHVNPREVIAIADVRDRGHLSPDGAPKRAGDMRAKRWRDAPIGGCKAHDRRTGPIFKCLLALVDLTTRLVEGQTRQVRVRHAVRGDLESAARTVGGLGPVHQSAFAIAVWIPTHGRSDEASRDKER